MFILNLLLFIFIKYIYLYMIYTGYYVFSSPQIYSLQELQIILKYVMWINGLYSSLPGTSTLHETINPGGIL